MQSMTSDPLVKFSLIFTACGGGGGGGGEGNCSLSVSQTETQVIIHSAELSEYCPWHRRAIPPPLFWVISEKGRGLLSRTVVAWAVIKPIFRIL